MPRFKIVVAYDGTDYVGWQRQENGVSIQELIEDALRAIEDRDVTLYGAGRTDAGVHALGQVASFTLERSMPIDALVRAINVRLPHAVRVLSAELVAADFHPQFSARGKTYVYRIWNSAVMSPFESRYAWHIPSPLDVEAMGAAARLIVGRHDFAAFQSTGGTTATTEREISASMISVASGLIAGGVAVGDSAARSVIYEVTGNGFLRHMVRAIVGTLVEIGHQRQPIEWITQIVAARNRAMAGPTAPAHGLFLVRVDHDSPPCG
jgi:tRNA pseudouridine38-40 synthase